MATTAKLTSSRSGFGLVAAAVLTASLGWYPFISNSLTAPSRGRDLYADALAIGATFEATPAIILSSVLGAMGTWILMRSSWFSFLFTAAALGAAQYVALDIVWYLLEATQ